ncbi:phage portal protein [endosymbiont of Acanthamoeba sp. UWC8]|uniref:phage portal protein n=1 Tax=endosymbiont of Acanthamoeba sp. UWC8 TaxID=86106 RepID=UPI000571BF14
MNLDSSYIYALNKPVWMDREYRIFASEAYMKNVIAHRSITMIAQSAASVPFKLYLANEAGKVPIEKHPILDLLNNPNPVMSGKELMESIYAYRLINGNAYLLAIGSERGGIEELVSLRPDRVAVIAGHNFMPSGYRYTVGSKSVDYNVDPITGYSSLLHIKNFHPLSDWYGLSSIESAAYSIDQHNQAGAWNQALLQNGARPSGAITVKNSEGNPANLSEEQFNRLKNMVDENFTGANNAGRPLILEGGLEWKEMSMSPKDMDFIESKHSSARDIALAFGMPPQLLGIPGDNTYSNLVEARLALWEQTIIPLIANICEHLSSWFGAVYGREYTVTYDTDSITALALRRESIWERVQNASFMTINEKRAAVGLAPLKEGDKL